MRKFFATCLVLLSVVSLVSYAIWTGQRPAGHYLSDLRIRLAINEGEPSERGNLLGIAGQGGVLVLSTGMQAQTLDVSWGEQNRSQCRLHIDPAAMTLAEGYRMQALTCSQ
ncbi:hypothetical protein F2S73_28410 [Pseudomonas syringae pv. actinidiae]|nr:hypothetical protein [Pseudomonas syringae pv. actinidiae]